MSESRRVRFYRWPLLTVAFAVLLTAATAAAQISTGTIEVFTLDQDELALPGVTVRVTNEETGLSRVVVTGGTGGAVFPALPPGSYTVGADLASFAPVRQEGVVIRVGQTARVDITMTPQLSETITVTAEAPLVDVYKTDSSTNIIPEQIEQLPTQDRDFQKLAFIAPGVVRERGGFRFITNAPVIGASGNASQATILVDGVDYTDQALGLARTRFSQDAIREFRVIQNRFDTEIGGSAGGALSVVTKTGTNDVHGSVFGFWRDDSLREQGELETGEQDFSRYQAGFTVGGPIVRDRTHYFVSTEYIDEENIALFRPQGAFADMAEDVDHPFEQLLLLGSITHRPSDSHSLAAKVVGEYYREDNFRVGGVADVSSGMELNRDNWNVVIADTWMIDDDNLNELTIQVGRKNFDEPNNSDALSEYFSNGTTLVTGANIVGDQEMTGDYFEVRDTYHRFLESKSGSHEVKLGGSFQRITEEWYYPVFPQGQMYYLTDDRSLPYLYNFGVGSPKTEVETTLIGAFIQDDWRPAANLSLSAGLRYDYDTDGNNPDFEHPMVGPRDRDENNFQPRAGFSWDIGNDGTNIVRGGAGLFTGRYLLVPSFVELQQNGVTGRTLYSRLNGLILGLPPEFWLDPNDPENTGILLPPNIALLEDNLRSPETFQATLGYTRRLGDTSLYLDLEGVYAEGWNEIIIRDVNFGGNDNPVRPNPAYTMVNMYTNEGRSEYKAVMASLNGTFGKGHLVTASVTWGDKKNIADDFSPALTNYPSDPADIEAEWGRSRGDEEWRAVLSGVFYLPWGVTVAPIFEYGSGLPWNHRLGYDFNGDLRPSDRPAGVPRNSEEGPEFKQFNLRITKSFNVGDGHFDLIAEAFNLFDTTNYDVNSVDSSEFLAGPTLADPTVAYVPNPNFGNYSATLQPLEIQLGVRYRF